MAKRSEAAISESAPSLRGALWLYFFVVLGTAWITISLSSSIEPLFIRFAVALFVVLGFTFAAARLSRLPMTVLFGRTPQVTGVIVTLLLGVALFFPFQWLAFITQVFLDNNIGVLPPPISSPTITQLGYTLQFGLIVPLCYALLFWGYIQRGAESAFQLRGAILTAVLFALYGMFMTDLTASAISGFLLVGLCAALVVYYTKNLWYGFAVNAGFNLAYINLQAPLIDFLKDDLHNPFSIRWLMAVIVTGFIAFILFQGFRFRSVETVEQPTATPRRLWWVPLLLIAAVYVFIIIGELVLRSQQPAQRPSVGMDNVTVLAMPPTETLLEAS